MKIPFALLLSAVFVFTCGKIFLLVRWYTVKRVDLVDVITFYEVKTSLWFTLNDHFYYVKEYRRDCWNQFPLLLVQN